MFQDTIKKAERILSCSSCQWDQFCIKPPVMTEDEVKRKIDEKEPKPGLNEKDAAGAMMSGFISMMLFAGKDSTCPACPKFIDELRKDDTLIRKIKQMMKESC